MTTIHHNGSVSTRFPQDCPDAKEGFCFPCSEGECHDCLGSGSIEHDDIGVQTCFACSGTGKLEAQLLFLAGEYE